MSGVRVGGAKCNGAPDGEADQQVLGAMRVVGDSVVCKVHIAVPQEARVG